MTGCSYPNKVVSVKYINCGFRFEFWKANTECSAGLFDENEQQVGYGIRINSNGRCGQESLNVLEGTFKDDELVQGLSLRLSLITPEVYFEDSGK